MAITEGDTKSDSRLIFTYGTLKRGFPNHSLMENLIDGGNVVFVGEYTTVETFPLACGPYGIPYLINIRGSGHRVRGELYKVNSGGLGPLDDLEGIEIGHYERLPVTVAGDGGETVAAEAHFAHRSFGEGMWKRCGEKGLKNPPLMELGNKYERKEERPSNHVSLQDIRNFITNGD
ncbi:putative gamma-glutamylcyclotransferase At3g02910 [Solanum verrucosum]|uniref:putative gamma-glutamylcyclotransferase At3g02910 n=1 Tax=Solanum verrucosum TaxID=315347 RepID=UPI0020D1DC4D|nr:putative gamma-glutamylcyclotransferase At3g02910 [Solanum verrucosum]